MASDFGKRFACRTCKREVKPVNGRLKCCGYDEPVPEPDTRAKCSNCGGVFHLTAADEFLGHRHLCDCGGDEDDYE